MGHSESCGPYALAVGDTDDDVVIVIDTEVDRVPDADTVGNVGLGVLETVPDIEPDAVDDTVSDADADGDTVGDAGTQDELPGLDTRPPLQLLHTDAPEPLYWFTPHM